MSQVRVTEAEVVLVAIGPDGVLQLDEVGRHGGIGVVGREGPVDALIEQDVLARQLLDECDVALGYQATTT